MANEELAKHKIRVAYIDEATFDEKGWKLLAEFSLPAAFRADKSDAEAKAMVGHMKALISAGNMLMVLVDDPDKKVIRVEGVDTAAGERHAAHHGTERMYMIQTGAQLAKLRKKPPPKLDELHIMIKTSAGEKSATFIVQDIPLP